MGLLFESLLTDLLAVAIVLATAIFLWLSNRFTYWNKKGLRQPSPVIPFGNISKAILGQNRLDFVLAEIYNQFRDEKCVGIYNLHNPAVLLIDPDLVRLVMIKDFDSFSDRNFNVDERDLLNHNLVNLNGSKWKRLRTKLSPTFTSGKLKIMFETMQKCGEQLVEVLKDKAERQEVLEMREITARFSTDIIASVAFGIESDCQHNPDTPFRQMGRKMFEPAKEVVFREMMYMYFPAIAKAMRLPLGVREVLSYFRNLVKETIEYREVNGVVRNDFLHLMMQLKNKGFVDDKKTGNSEVDTWKLCLDEVAAQAVVFYAGGFETSSTTMGFALHELALNPQVQQNLQKEVEEAMKKNDGKLTYEAISEMPYLDKVVSEALRKHPPVPMVARRCTHDYKLPNNGPVIEKGTDVFIPVYAFHHDPKYFPEPKRFDPERFSQEEKSKRNPYVYLPFGEGPRNCIGMRMGLLQTKIGLAYFMSQYGVQPCEQTRDPLEYNKRSVVLMPETGIHLKVVKK